MTNKRAVTGIYAALHFLVDFCCAFFMFRLSSASPMFYLHLFTYNFCAFALQMPVGLLADHACHSRITAAIGCTFTGTAFLFPLFVNDIWFGSFWLQTLPVLLLGLGNCFFHVGGGIEVLHLDENRLTPLGIFVSPGAIGIYLGNISGQRGQNGWFSAVLLLIALFSGAALLLLWQSQTANNAHALRITAALPPAQNRHLLCAALICFFLVVCFRSHLGMVLNLPWKKEVTGGLLCLSALVLGKAAGGILADRFGVRKTAFASLLLAAILFPFSALLPAGVAAVFFFNMSMPITLYLAAKLLRGTRGFAFGLLTFAIFIGFLPAYLGFRAGSPGLLTLYSLCSLIFMVLGCILYGKYIHCPAAEEAGEDKAICI